MDKRSSFDTMLDGLMLGFAVHKISEKMNEGADSKYGSNFHNFMKGFKGSFDKQELDDINEFREVPIPKHLQNISK